MPPAYRIAEFVQACQEGAILIWKEPQENASNDFSLYTSVALMEFIGNNGLEDLCFDRCRALDIWKPPPPAPMVDSYTFSTGRAKGYLAFFKSPVTGIWNLKSFKRDSRSTGLNLPFKDLGKLLSETKPEDTETKGGPNE